MQPVESTMWRLRVLSLLSAAAWAGPGKAALLPQPQQPEITPTTVVSGSDRRWTSMVGLKVIVRDVDQPDSSVSDVRIILERVTARSANPLYATADSAGIATLVAPDSGDYHVRVLRIGYDPLRLRMRLEVKCQQMLEAYIARGTGIRERPIYTPGKEPTEFRAILPTGGRAVLTTCAAPLPNGR